MRPNCTLRISLAVLLIPGVSAGCMANSSAAPLPIQTASINALVSTVEPAGLAVYPSADKKWQAEVIRHDCMEYPFPDYTARIAYEQLKLILGMQKTKSGPIA